MAAVVAMLFGVSAASAAIPEHLYMCGPATSVGWDAGNGVQLTKVNGVFTYTGHLNAADLIFMDSQSWGRTRYAPKLDKSTLGDQNVEVVACQSGAEQFDYHWVTKDGCKYKVTVTFANDGNNVKIAAEKVQETAGVPEKLYMVGPATTAGWDVNNAIEMTGDGNGTFTYEGDLYRSDIIFLTGRNWESVRYVPENGGTSLSEENKSIFISTDGGDSRHWMVDCAGTWNVTVKFTNNGKDVTIKARRISGPSHVIPLGAASNQWNSAEPNNSIMPATDTGVYEWVGKMPTGDDRHFKFISHTGEWNSNIDFYLPKDTDAPSTKDPQHCSIKNVELDKEYPVKTGWNGNGDLESYWCLPTTAQADENDNYKVTLNLNNNTIKFEKRYTVGIGIMKANSLNARFVGDALVVESAGDGVSVYDISGRKVAQSNGSSLTANGLPDGVYVVKGAGTSIKIAK